MSYVWADKPEFKEFGKIPRLSREMIVTEKIDGTNAQILVPEDPAVPLLAGSRTRWLEPGKHTDNFGFAAWVQEHEADLRLLGPGRHFGEWFGKGIQRGYGLEERRFALFNVSKWFDPSPKGPMPLQFCIEATLTDMPRTCPECCTVVPMLYLGVFDTRTAQAKLTDLKVFGSQAVPGFREPEGIVIYHVAAGKYFKKTLEGDEQPKSLVA